ncbi:MAG: hypothetical protein ACREK7_04565 [Gemmatimonadota bacterium]
MTDETTTNGPDPRPEPGIEEELRNLGRRFADVFQAAWASEERRKVETEMRDRMKRFSDEMERLFERTRESPTGERVRTKFGEARGRAAESEAARRTRETLAQGLHRMSEELARLAERFTPAETDTGSAERPPPDDHVT